MPDTRIVLRVWSLVNWLGNWRTRGGWLMGDPGLVAALILLVVQRVMIMVVNFQDECVEEQYILKRNVI